MRKLALALAAALSLAACAQQSTGASTQTKASPKNRNIITSEEIATVSVSDAYQLIQQLRPNFLRTQGGVSSHNDAPPVPLVFVDGVQIGDVTALHNVSSSGIVSVEYLNGMMATQRFGTNAGGGAIMITTAH
jgi:TonB-dependent Receptor Plug Domain